jgi:hypothetical protein
MRRYGMATKFGTIACDAYHGGLTPPLATVDWGRRCRVVGIPDRVRYLCDQHARGLVGWRDVCRMIDAPAIETRALIS